jgi:hypothetical protein
MNRAKCGTYAGVAEHDKAHETVCNECRTAKAIYMREYRARLALGLPLASNAKYGSDEEPAWKRRRPDLADLTAVGPVLDAAWRWGA